MGTPTGFKNLEARGSKRGPRTFSQNFASVQKPSPSIPLCPSSSLILLLHAEVYAAGLPERTAGQCKSALASSAAPWLLLAANHFHSASFKSIFGTGLGLAAITSLSSTASTALGRSRAGSFLWAHRMLALQRPAEQVSQSSGRPGIQSEAGPTTSSKLLGPILRLSMEASCSWSLECTVLKTVPAPRSHCARV